jgi:hypothetical protein
LPRGFEEGGGLFVMVGRSGMFALYIKDICFCPQSYSFGFLVLELLRDGYGSIGETEGAWNIDSNLFSNFVCEF